MHPFKIRLAFDNGMYVVRPKMIQNIGEAGKKEQKRQETTKMRKSCRNSKKRT
jgi:hypothetical protein